MGERDLVVPKCSRRPTTHDRILGATASRRDLIIMVACAVVLSSALTLSLLENLDAPDSIKARAMYNAHDPVFIASDGDWAASGFPGDGIEGDPYIVSGYVTTGVQEVDVTYPYEIPQFGSLMGFLLAVALVGVIGVDLLRRRR